MKKRFWSMLLVVAMCLTMLPVTALAAGSNTPTDTSVASVTIGDTTTYYDNISDAWEAAQDASSAEVTLLRDTSISETLTVSDGDDITLNCDNYTLTRNVSSSNVKIVEVTGGNFTLTGGTLSIHSTMTGSVSCYGIYVSGGNATVEDGTIEVIDNTTDTGGKWFYGVRVMESGIITIENGTIIVDAGKQKNDTGVGVQAYQNGTAIINGGTISGTGAMTGDGVWAYNGKTTNVTITGGTFVGSRYGVHMGSQSGVTVTLSGGRFTGDIAAVHSFTKDVFTLLEDDYCYYKVIDSNDSETYEYTDTEISSGNNHDLTGATYIIGAKTVTAISVTTQPTNMIYTSGDALNLTGLTINVSYNDGTTKTITDLETEGLTITPANGTALTVADNNNQKIQISYGGKTCETDALTVSQAEQEELTITGVPEKIYSGDTFTLETTGGSGDGAITWKVVSGNATIDENGKVTVTGTGDIIVKATKAGNTEYTSAETTVTFTAQKKPGVVVTPTYPPTIPDTDNGDVTVSPSSPKQGDTVTITPKPDDGYQVDKVTVTDSNGKEVTVKDNGDGTYSFTQPSGKVTITVTFKATGCPKDATCPISKFTDSTPTAWYHNGVHYVLDEGLMVGISDTEFAPNATLTRAELAQILYNKAGKPAVTGLSTFTDVPATAWYAKAVAWAQQNNVVSGIGGNQFAPNQTITREQIAVMLYNNAGKPKVSGTITGFADAANVSEWAYDAVLWATQNDVVNGALQSNGTRLLNPTSGATRAETAALLANFYNQ